MSEKIIVKNNWGCGGCLLWIVLVALILFILSVTGLVSLV